MPPDPSADPAYLWDMLDAAVKVQEFVRSKSFEHYVGDELLRAGVERKIEIIGEAARKVSQVTQDAHPEIPWRPIMAQRHVLAHDYGDIQHDRIWRVATIYVPDLVAKLRPLIPTPPAAPTPSAAPTPPVASTPPAPPAPPS